MSTRIDRYTKHEETVINFSAAHGIPELSCISFNDYTLKQRELCIVYVRTLPPLKHEMRHLMLYPNVKQEGEN